MSPTLTQYRKRPVVISAAQWFKNGDHPLDYSRTHDGIENGLPRKFSPEERRANGWEGDIVRYFRHPDVQGERICQHCKYTMHEHGWIDTLEGGHIVCPCDWIITGVKGEHYPCKPDIFAATYEPVTTQPQADAGERCSSFIVAIEDGGDWENPKVTHFKCLKCSGVGADHLTVKHYDHCALLAAPAPAAERSDPRTDEHGETPESYTEIGQTFMEEYRGALNHPAMKDFICADSPSEIIQHLLNAIDEPALRAPAPVDAEKLAKLIWNSFRPGLIWSVFDKSHYVACAKALLDADIFAVPKPDKRLRVGQWALAQFIMDEIPKNHLHSATTVAGHIVDRFNDAVLVGSTETEKPA